MIACKDCTHRHHGCHDTCPVHQAELAEDHAKKEYVSRTKKIYRSVDEAHYSSVRKAERKCGRRK